MKIDEFVMERWQSNWEHVVNYNISESGVKALMPEELLSPEELEKLSKTKLGYIQTNGTKQLKETICALYDEASPENILAQPAFHLEANLFIETDRSLVVSQNPQEDAVQVELAKGVG